MAQRIGLFGGTFDPIHDAHLQVARAAARRFALNQVLVIPAAHPPHKPGRRIAPYEDRLAMAQLAVQGDPVLVASDLERGEQRSYSILTIERVRRERPGDELFFLIGADAFADVGTWHRHDEVVRLITFIVVSRPGHAYPVPPGARVLRLDELALAISSSNIRATLAAGGKPIGLPETVYEYARSHGLYDLHMEP